MDILIELTYAAIVFFAFRVFKIPVNKWTVTTSVVGGVFVVGGIFLCMAYYHPYTPQGRIYFQTTPIVSQVRGKVIEVAKDANKPLKAGDVLFKIDPTPFQAKVDDVTALVEEEKASFSRLEKEVDQAKAQLEKAEAEFKLAKVTEERNRQLVKSGGIAEERYDRFLAARKTAEQDVVDAEAGLVKAQDALAAQNSVILEAKAKLDKARFDLDSATVRAPTNGYATQVRLEPGMMAVPLPLRPVLTFVNSESPMRVGAFKQNPLQNIRPGHRAEVIFPAIPGRAFTGTVTKVMEALAEGQLQPSGDMLSVTAPLSEGRVPVFIKLDKDMSEYNLPLGSAASVAVYGKKMEALAVIRQVLLRMMSWKNVICFEVL